MVKRISTSQLKSELRRLQSKQRNAINNYNREVRKYNTQVRKVNTEIRRNRQIIIRELNKLNASNNTSYIASVKVLNRCYQNITYNYNSLSFTSNKQEDFYDLIEKENVNNLITANVLNGDEELPDVDVSLNDSIIGDKLKLLSSDLNDRWYGALFSLNPKNPDAARHFCTSSREIFTDIFNNFVSDEEVFNTFPNCEKTDRGNATRRWKIKYFLNKKGIDIDGADEFVDKDIENILELYHVLGDGTHGNAGKYSIIQLKSIKKRVEDGIIFLCNIV